MNIAACIREVEETHITWRLVEFSRRCGTSGIETFCMSNVVFALLHFKVPTCLHDAKTSVIVLQTYTRFVEIGRIAYIAFGPDVGKLVAVVDVIDQNRVCLPRCFV